MSSIKEAIFAAKDSNMEKVEVPEWNTTLYIKSMTGVFRDEFEAKVGKGKDGLYSIPNYRSYILVNTICDAEGTLVFNEDEIGSLGNMSAKVISELFDIATRLSGITKAEVDKLEKK